MLVGSMTYPVLSNAHIEDNNTVEHTTDGLCDVSTRWLCFGSSTKEMNGFIQNFSMLLNQNQHLHSDELHSLEGEGSLYKDGQDSKESIGVGILDKSSAGDGSWVFPVLYDDGINTYGRYEWVDETYTETNTLVVRSSSKIND